jgi:hypothetical protein
MKVIVQLNENEIGLISQLLQVEQVKFEEDNLGLEEDRKVLVNDFVFTV